MNLSIFEAVWHRSTRRRWVERVLRRLGFSRNRAMGIARRIL